jgi:hypothetical protein
MSMNLHLIRTALATAALCAILPAAAHESDGKLGSVHFKVSCNAEAQREFDLAMAYYHSFAWEQIKAPLERALAAWRTGRAPWPRWTTPSSGRAMCRPRRCPKAKR